MKIALVVFLVTASLGLADGKIKSFGPVLYHKTFVTQLDSGELLKPRRLVARDTRSSYINFAKTHIKSKLGFKEGYDYKILRSYTSDARIGYVYFKQLIQGKEVFNGDMNISIDLVNGNEIITFGDSFYKGNKQPKGSRFFSSSKKIKSVKKSLVKSFRVAIKGSGVALNNFDQKSFESSLTFDGTTFIYAENKNGMYQLRATQGWLQLSDDEIVPVWSMDIKIDYEYFNAKVSLLNGKLVAVNDLVSEVTYRVYPITTDGAQHGHRQLLKNPADPVASPLGWHNNGKKEFKYTRGNNVNAQFSTMPDLNSLLSNLPGIPAYAKGNSRYDFPLNINDKNTANYIDASITNAFYVTNTMHDLLFRYGFDEASGNFQEKNFGTEGKDDDAIQLYPQLGFFKNRASFYPGADGFQSMILLGIFEEAGVGRDSSFDNSAICHEYGHGLSTRLVGGADNIQCLSEREAKGMGEGWSDMLAIMLLMKPEYTRELDIGVSEFVTFGKGVRDSKYSLDYKTNSRSYSNLNSEIKKHEIGHLWATMLYEVYWNLVDKLGFTSDWMGQGSKYPTKFGNTLMLKLMIESMKLMPCNPTFLQARDNLILADKQITNGENFCEIWEGFAKRGLGVSASSKVQKISWNPDVTTYYENLSPPNDCYVVWD